MEYRIQQVELYNTTDEILEQYLDFQERYHKTLKHDEVLRSRDYRKKSALVKPGENTYSIRYGVFEEGYYIGSGYAEYRMGEKETNDDMIWFDITVDQEYQNQGIATQILRKLVEYAQEQGKTKIEAGFHPIDCEISEPWLFRMGFKHGFTERVSRLYKEKINWDFVNEKKKLLEPKLEKYDFLRLTRKERSDRILAEDDFADAMADYFTEADNLLPREDAEWNDIVMTAGDMRRIARRNLELLHLWDDLAYFALDGDNIIANSGSYYPKDPPVKDVGTGLTAVRKAYQRQGIATYLKILIVEDYIKNQPEFEYIQTENAQSNQGMLAINYALGFESVYEWTLYQAQIEDIKKYLESKN